MTKKYDILGIGNALLDKQYEVSQEIIESLGYTIDQMTLVSQEELARIITFLNQTQCKHISECGGSVTNSLAAASSLGSSCFHICKVASDSDGTIYSNNLEKLNISSHCLTQSTSIPTGNCLVMVTPDSKRTMLTFLGISSTLDANEIDLSLVSASRLIYCEGYMVIQQETLQATRSLIKEANRQHVPVTLSLSDPGIVSFFKSDILSLCKHSIEIIFCNDAEAMALSDTNSIEIAFNNLKSYARQFVITLGAKGVLLWDGAKKIHLNAYKVNAIDTNGAGDIFAGTFLSMLNKDKSFVEAGKFANFSAAQLVQKFGPRFSEKEYQELQTLFINIETD